MPSATPKISNTKLDASMGSPGGGGPVGGGGLWAAIVWGNSKHSPKTVIFTIWGRIIGF